MIDTIDIEKYRQEDGFFPDWFLVFDHCSDWIAAALEHAGDTHTLGDIADGIAQGRFILWPGTKSAVITEIIQYPQLKCLNYFLAGGNMEELKKMRPDIEMWAKHHGVTRVTLAGRKGWLRSFLKDEGYSEKWSVMAKDI